MTKTYSTDPIVQEVCTDDMATIANDTLMRRRGHTVCGRSGQRRSRYDRYRHRLTAQCSC
jgi:hypothetical protein